MIYYEIYNYYITIDFKSDPNKTTADNINVYLEKRNINSYDVKPKFTTIMKNLFIYTGLLNK